MESSKTTEVLLQCVNCEAYFKSIDALSNHIKTVHTKTVKAPATQKKDIQKGGTLKTDIQKGGTQKRDISYMCIDCKKTFKTKLLLRAHRNTCAVKAGYDSIGQGSPEEIGDLQLGQSSEVKKRVSFVCAPCGERFYTRIRLNQHKLTCFVTGGDHVCDICDSSFQERNQLMTHLKTHNIPSSSTAQAGSSDMNKDGFEEVGTNETGVECRFCGKTFQKQYNMRRHVIDSCKSNPARVEWKQAIDAACGETAPACGGSKKLVCEKCSLEFVYRTNLVKHQNKCLNKSKCIHCKAYFDDNAQLSVHLKGCPNVPQTCIDCGGSVMRCKMPSHKNICKRKPSSSSVTGKKMVLIVNSDGDEEELLSDHSDGMYDDIDHKKVLVVHDENGVERIIDDETRGVEEEETPLLESIYQPRINDAGKKKSPSSSGINQPIGPGLKRKGTVVTMDMIRQSRDRKKSKKMSKKTKENVEKDKLEDSILPAQDGSVVVLDKPGRKEGDAPSPEELVRLQLDTLVKSLRLNLEDANVVDYPNFDIHEDVMEQIRYYYKLHWTTIMSHIYLSSLHSVYNMRFGENAHTISSLRSFLFNQLYARQRYVFRINTSPGFFLYSADFPREGSEYGVCSYFYPHFSNALYWEKPILITNYSDFAKFVSQVEEMDLGEFARRRRSDTKTTVLFCCQLSFSVTKVKPYVLGGETVPENVGCGLNLPPYISKRRSIISLTHRCVNKTIKSKKRLYTDNMCVWRCLVLALGLKLKCPTDIDAYATLYYRLYYGADADPIRYPGFPLSDLHKMERLFNININVFTLKIVDDEDTGDSREECEIIRESSGIYKRTMNCNLYKDHFSYIVNLPLFSRRYVCSKCRRLFGTFTAHKRHRQTDCSSVKNIYPGGVYSPPPTIFQQLEGCGIEIGAEIPRFFTNFLIFDLESWQTQGGLPPDTPSVIYETCHHLCSSAIVGTFGSYTKPKVFIVDSENGSEKVAMDTLQYMLSASSESYR